MKNQQPPWYLFIAGLCSIIDGLCMVVTLGFWLGPELRFKLALCHAKRPESVPDKSG